MSTKKMWGSLRPPLREPLPLSMRILQMVTLCALLLALLMPLSSDAKQTERVVARNAKVTYVMPCSRWAALVQGIASLGSENMKYYMASNPRRFDNNDYTFLPDATKFAKGLSSQGTSAYAYAMLECGEWKSS